MCRFLKSNAGVAACDPHSPSTLADTRRIRDHARAWVSGIGPLPVRRSRDREARRAEEDIYGERAGRGTRATRRNGGAGQRDVSEQSERWRLIDWFVGGRIISRTRTAPTHCARLITIVTSLTYVCVYVCIYHGQYERPGRGRKLVMLAMSTALTKARRVRRLRIRHGGTFERWRWRSLV